MSENGGKKSKEEAASDGKNASERSESDLVRQHLSSPSPPQSCHDSCYNSDTENSPPASPGVVPQHSGSLAHEDVSRQVSDTLRAEHEDTQDLGTDIIKASDYPSYQAKVEFAVKLGYTEKLLQKVLRSCGPDIEQNELLCKLIELSSLEGDGEESVTEDFGDLVISPPQKEFLTSSHQTHERTKDTQDESDNLRPIIIDGSNVALSHGNKQVFSCRGIQIVVDWFRKRGHKQIFAIVPSWRKEASRPDAQITDQDILQKLDLERVMVFTPARRVAGKRVVCYDDRYILKLAKDLQGIIVSNDNFRDLLSEFREVIEENLLMYSFVSDRMIAKTTLRSGHAEIILKLAKDLQGIIVSNYNFHDLLSEFREVIEENLLMYSFVSDSFMPPDDPLGRKGPSLDNFLRKEPLVQENLPPVCPYAKKCTYGNKCKFYHPERGQQPMKMVTEKLAEKARQELQKVKEKQEISKPAVKATVSTPALSETKQPIRRTVSNAPQKALLSRKQSLAPTNSFGAGKKAQGPKVSPTKVKVTPADDHISKSAGEQISYSGSNSRSALNPDTKISGKEGVGPNVKFGDLYPYHWGSRATLRPVNSEPIAQEMSSGENVISGHLAVAKKLSDEGRRSSSPKTQTGDSEGVYHRKVERTFSVKGNEDPRLQRMSKPGSAPAAKPKFYFGDEGHRQTNRQHSGVHKSQTPLILSRQLAHRQLSDVSAQHFKPGLDSHATIERMASAPSATSQEMQLLQTGFRTERQDSLSDPGLYIADQATGGRHDETPVFIDPPRKDGFYNNAGGNNVRISVSQHNPGLKVMVNQPKQNSSQMIWGQYPIMPPQDMTMPHPCVNFSTSSGPPMMSSGWTGTQSSVGNGQFFTPAQITTGQENQQGLPLYPGQSIHPSLPAQFIPAPGPLMMQNLTQHDPSVWRQIQMEAWHQNIQGNMAAFNASYHEKAPSARDAETEQKMLNDLSKIFPCDKVRRVMADHPEITDSSILCKYLV